MVTDARAFLAGGAGVPLKEHGPLGTLNHYHESINGTSFFVAAPYGQHLYEKRALQDRLRADYATAHGDDR